MPRENTATGLNIASRRHRDFATGVGVLHRIRADRGDTTYQIAADEVLFLQSDDKYTVAQTANGGHLITNPFSELISALDAEQFSRIHCGTVVNLRFVSSTRRNDDGRTSVNLKGYAKASPLSRAYRTCLSIRSK